MDISQEQLLKRLALLKQRIMEQYPELSEKMAHEHAQDLHDKGSKDHQFDEGVWMVPLYKKRTR